MDSVVIEAARKELEQKRREAAEWRHEADAIEGKVAALESFIAAYGNGNGAAPERRPVEWLPTRVEDAAPKTWKLVHEWIREAFRTRKTLTAKYMATVAPQKLSTFCNAFHALALAGYVIPYGRKRPIRWAMTSAGAAATAEEWRNAINGRKAAYREAFERRGYRRPSARRRSAWYTWAQSQGAEPWDNARGLKALDLSYGAMTSGQTHLRRAGYLERVSGGNGQPVIHRFTPLALADKDAASWALALTGRKV